MEVANEFESLWHEYRYEVACYLRKHIFAGVVDDLLQDVYLRAWAAMLDGRGWKVHPRAWLYRIARNLMIDWHRARGREPEWLELDAQRDYEDDGENTRSNGDVLVCDTLSPHDLAVQQMTVRQVRSAVRHLNERHAQYMEWRLEGYSHKEVAEMTGEKELTVRGVNTRAFAVLRQRLQEAA